MADSSVEVKVS